jgi:hypothetical protein
MKKELTKNQVLALSLFAMLNGRRWKECLRNAWCDGDYGRYGARGLDGYLQQVRNQFGPSWLIRYQLPKGTPQEQLLARAAEIEEAIKKAQ